MWWCETSAYTLSNNGLLSIINKLGWNLGIMRCLQFNSVIPYLYVFNLIKLRLLIKELLFQLLLPDLSCSTVSLSSTAEAISSSSCCFSFRWSCTFSSRSLRICSSRSSNAYRSNMSEKSEPGNENWHYYTWDFSLRLFYFVLNALN